MKDWLGRRLIAQWPKALELLFEAVGRSDKRIYGDARLRRRGFSGQCGL